VTAFIVLNNNDGRHGFAGTTIADVNRWCGANFGRDALHLAQTLTARFDAAFVLLRVISGDRLVVRARIFQGPTSVATLAFRLAPRTHQAHLSWLVLAPTARGGLVSKPLLQNLLLIERDCGVTRVTLHAGLSHGGYVWAMHGFLPETDAKWLQLATRLRAKLDGLALPLPPLQTQAIKQILSSSDRFALRAVAAAVTPVAKTTLGKHLLLGERWEGELDFSDRSSALIYFKRIGLLP
jgi:hypothetical protein